MSDAPPSDEMQAAREAAAAAAAGRGHSLGPFGPPELLTRGYSTTAAQEVARCTVCGAQVVAVAGLPPTGRALVFGCRPPPSPNEPPGPDTAPGRLDDILRRARGG